MRKILLLLSFLAALVPQLSAQVTLQFQNVTICDGQSTVQVPLTTDYSGQLSSVQFTMQWDATGLDLNVVTPNLNSTALTVNEVGNQAGISYSISPVESVMPGDTIMTFVFDVVGGPGVYPVEFVPGGFTLENVSDGSFATITPLNLVNGSVTILTDAPFFVNCPNDLTVNNSPGVCDGTATWTPPTVEDCDNNDNPPTVNFPPGSTFPVGTTTVTYDVSDADGNTGSCSFTVTVEDVEDPTISCAGDTSVLIPAGSAPASLSAAYFEPATTDNCAVTSVTYSFSGVTSGSGIYSTGDTYNFNVGNTTVTLTATDAAGNTATCSSNVNIQETDPNAITVKIADVTIDCGASTAAVPLIIQDDITATSFQFGLEWASGLTYDDIDEPFPGDPITNLGMNSISLSQAFLAFDLLDGDTIYLLTFDVSGTPGNVFDINLTGTPTPVVSDDNFNNFSLNILGGSVTIDDDDPPMIVCPPDTVIDCNVSTDTSSTGSPVVTDDCTPNPTVTFSDVTSSTCGNTQIITRTFTATDGMGQTAVCVQTITVQDTMPPTAVCQDVEVFLDALGQATLEAEQVENGSTDDCGMASPVSVTPDAFDCNDIGSDNTVTLTVEDDCGNTATCTATVTVTDTVSPEVVCLDVTVQLDQNGDATVSPEDLLDDLNSDDNCSDVTAVSADPNAFTCDDLGDNIVVLTATDDEGNTGTCEATVTVEDNVPPVASCQDATIELDASGQATLNPGQVFDPVGSSDNCVNVTASSVMANAFNCANIGENQVVLTVEDGSGNTATCTATVTVEDNLPPNLVCQSATVYLDASGMGALQPGDVFDAANSSDNCNNISLQSVSPNVFDCEDIGSPISVTLLASDGQGNESTCTAQVTVLDTVSPNLVCIDPVFQLTNNGTVTAGGEDFADLVLTGDNCTESGDLIYSATQNSFDCSDVGLPQEITLTVTDESGNSSECISTVTILDNVPPTAVCNDITVSVPLSGITLMPAQVDGGSFDNCNVNLDSIVPAVFLCDDVGPDPVTVTLWVSDDSQNRDTCTAEVTLISADPPEVVCNDLTVYLDDIGAASITPDQVLNQDLSTSCGPLTPISVTPNQFDCNDLFNPQQVTLVASDNNGNIGTCTGLVTVLDTTAPTALCQDVTVSLFDFSATVMPQQLDNGSFDNCQVDLSDNSMLQVTCDDIGTPITATLTVSDQSGNTSTCTSTVTVEDAVPPSITCPFDVFVESNVPVPVSDIAPTSVSDNCFTDLDTTYTLILNGMNVGSGTGDASGTVFELGTTTVTYTVTDPSGNTASCSFFVTVSNTQPPMITCPADLTVNLTSLPCSTEVTGIGVTIEDPGAVANVDFFLAGATMFAGDDDASGSIFNIGVTTVDYVVTDTFGLSANCTFTVTVVDGIAPVITCPDDMTIATNPDSCNASVILEAPEVEDCSPVVTDYVLSGATNGVDFLTGDPVLLNQGLNVVSYTVTDSNNISTACFYEIVVNDSTPPVLNCPMDVVVPTDSALCSGTLTELSAFASDNCELTSLTYSVSGDSTFTDTLDISGTVLPTGEYTVTYFAEDESGNIDSCSFDVTVADTEDPVIACFSGDTTIMADPGQSSVPVFFVPDSTADNCGVTDTTWQLQGATTGTGSGALDTNINLGTTVVTFTVADGSGNVASCEFNVFVEEAPGLPLECPNDTMTVAPIGTCGDTLFNLGLTIIGDSASIDTVYYTLTGATTGNGSSDVSGTFFNVGPTTVTYFVEDVLGNVTSCSFQVLVKDEEDPTIDCPNSLSLNTEDDQCFAIGAWDDPVAADNCGMPEVTTNFAPGDTLPVGITVVTYVASDGSGNVAQCSFNVTVNDNQAPVVTCPTDLTVFAAEDLCGDTLDNIGVTVVENCSVGSVEYELQGATTGTGMDDASGNFFNGGVTTVVYEVTDGSGNVGQCQFEVTVLDTFPPAVVCPPDVTIQVEDTVSSIPVAKIDPVSVTENCDQVDTSYVLEGATTGSGAGSASGQLFNDGLTTVTYIVEDEAGNTDTCMFTVFVDLVEKPTIICPGDTSVFSLADTCGAFVDDIGVIVTSDSTEIGDTTYVLSGATTGSGMGDASGTFFSVGETTVTYTVSNILGQDTSCSFTVTVVDTIPPTLTCPPDITVDGLPDTCGAFVTWVDPLAEDNCDLEPLFCSANSGDFFPAGPAPTTVTCAISDLSGNNATCSFSVLVRDTVAPNLVCPSGLVVETDPGECGAIVNGLEPLELSDNCSEAFLSYNIQINTTGAGNGDASGEFFNLGGSLVTYFASDESGNDASCSFTVAVVDTEAPVIECPNDTIFEAAPNEFTTLVNGVDPVISDNCTIVDTSYVLTGATSGSGSGFLDTLLTFGVTNVTYIITDQGGNVDSCSFEVQVVNLNPPKIDCPDDIITLADTGKCSAFIGPIPVDVQADSNIIDTIFYELEMNGMIVGSGPDDASNQEFPVGVTTVTYNVIDVFGNLAECSFVIEVLDRENPVIACPDTMLLDVLPGTCSNFIDTLMPVQMSDNCGVDTLYYTLSGATAGNGAGILVDQEFQLGTTTVTFCIEDPSGNIDCCSFPVIVSDPEPPTITCASDTLVYTGADACAAEVCGLLPEVDDNCAVNFTTYVATGATSGTGNATDCLTFELGTTQLTYTVFDNSGNSSSCSLEVTVADTIPPVMNCSDLNVSANTIFGQCVNDFALNAPEVLFDNCEVSSLTYSYLLPDSTTATGDVPDTVLLGLGTTIMTYTAADGSGNISTCTFELTVVDTVAPEVVNCPLDTTVFTAPGECEIEVDDIGLDPNEDIFENCTVDTIIYTLEGATVDTGAWNASGTIFNEGTTTVTYLVFDNSGNSDTCVFDVVVEKSPVIISFSQDSVCEGADIVLSTNVDNPPDSLIWTGPNEFISNEANPVIDSALVTDGGEYCVTVFFGDDCSFQTCDTLTIFDAPDIVADTDSILCTDGSLDATLQGINQNPDLELSWEWTDPEGNFLSDDQNPVIPNVAMSNSGTYTVTATSPDGCVETASVFLFVTDKPNTPTAANGCADVVCLDMGLGFCELNGFFSGPDPDSVLWTSDTMAIAGLPTPANAPGIIVAPTEGGIISYEFTVFDNGCPSDPAVVEITVLDDRDPIAVDDTFSVVYNGILNNSVVLNDDLVPGSGFTVELIGEGTLNGDLVLNPDGTFSYTPAFFAPEGDGFRYRICYEDCPDHCDEGTVIIELTLDQEECLVSPILTPNGDGDNDQLIISCLQEDSPENELIIFNQWGDEVFRAAPYVNGSWDGTYEGNPLPSGTYFYLFRLDPGAETLKGYITIFND